MQSYPKSHRPNDPLRKARLRKARLRRSVREDMCQALADPERTARYTSGRLTDARRDLDKLRLKIYQAALRDPLIGKAPLKRWARLAECATEELIDCLQVLAARDGGTSEGNREGVHVATANGASTGDNTTTDTTTNTTNPGN